MGALILDHEFYCCKCGSRGLPIVRVKGKERAPGHLKRLWCLTCNDTINHVECVPGSRYSHDDFLFEFEHHNFDEQQNRILPYGIFKDKMKKEGVI
jgi:hypothetical protein